MSFATSDVIAAISNLGGAEDKKFESRNISINNNSTSDINKLSSNEENQPRVRHLLRVLQVLMRKNARRIPKVSSANKIVTKILYNSSKVLSKSEAHIFSKKHIRNGIMDLGKNKQEILNNIDDVVRLNMDKAKEGLNILYKRMNGNNATIHFFVKDGEVISVDAFKGLGEIRDASKINFIK